MNRFYIIDNSKLQSCVSAINKIRDAGGIPIVSISDKAESRSSKQNRLMHQWFKDIHNMTQSGLEYESGRCKYAYFLPVMASSENEEARNAYELIKLVEHERGYEYVCTALGMSLLASTRTLKTKEFADAMRAMQMGEYMHCLTDPSMMGLDMGRWE